MLLLPRLLAAAGGSLGRVGVFSLGIVPYINASILLQLLATAFPSLKKLQREEGPQGRARFQQYQKLAALVFAVAQAAGQLTYLRPYVDDFSAGWLAESVLMLTTGAMILVYVSAVGGCLPAAGASAGCPAVRAVAALWCWKQQSYSTNQQQQCLALQQVGRRVHA